MTRARAGTRIRLADVLGGLSMVADLGFGLPPGEAMRSCLVATALARELDLPEPEVADAFYAALLMHVGCVSMSHETSVLFGNELRLTRAVAMTNLGDPQDWTDTLLPEISRGLDASAGERLGATLITRGPSFGRLYDTASGEVGKATARRIGLPPGTQRALYEDAESWSGDGAPRGLKGDEIALPARIVRVASDAAFFDDIGKGGLAVDALKKRSGGTLDPAIVDVFVRHSSRILDELNAGDPRDRILEVEPHPVAERDENELIEIATAFADAADLKTPFMHQHSTGVAALASSAAERGGLDRAQVEELRIAALLHDLGRVGVSDAIWEKPGALTTAEWEMVRMHPYHSERMLTISRTLEPVARTAGMHHERSDGSGYHRGSRGAEIPMTARVLAAADAFVAMTQERPHRPALEPEQAAQELKRDVRDAKLDPEAVAAVLGVAGQDAGGSRALRPSGLSEREVEVLRLLAEGYSNPDIAERLTVSRRTAEHHVQHIYAKIGVSTRPGAALFALQHHLLS
jgi:HD-GYP domain-containing protein (c-di-GMP phosphodiesterase class II)